jgi:hypothetical protein
MPDIERLICCALNRDGVTHKGFRSHSDLRGQLGDEDPYKEKCGDEYGFWTSCERFVNRWESAAVAYGAGQTRTPDVKLLSSEVEWDAKPKVAARPERKLYGKQSKRLFRA